ncbi:hypothetical protein CLOBY_18030 [Clostridium saccharobutylicum]|uniref:hypothetical protein n=1 Tax=Clostridium saccharobutylicum TaxID=169679 RepID=UPI000983D69A|nr:hypothetical protein [Clostridium saccharobutylicum]AQS09672.1 hypothetical protein CLOBY_18030 [Clostridium saccharobutylicum]MBC2436933.1 hypothetical protein [Clostridium saccharobutylicum]NSB89284.1 Ca2+-dependent lipid-binding protein [Clostridium saccharobutylicum]NYC27938.1 Ca2+-dependent lipid-binding protein [Clostridium saccharobutylicum]OOM17133.1 hypothetical protein CLSAB_20810 [Clostridium saccharobutylicum]
MSIMNEIKEQADKQFEADKERLSSPELKEFNRKCYDTHIKLLFAGIISLVIGFVFVPVFLISMCLIVASLICMATHWKQINNEYKIRKNINKK